MTQDGRLHQHAFPSMGSEIEILLYGRGMRESETAFAGAKALADQWVNTFSRFDSSSELSRLNGNPGQPVPVSPFLFRAVEAALWGARVTNDLFDPTVHDALVAAGYDRTFRDVLMATGPAPCRPKRAPSIDGIVLDPSRQTVMLPSEVHLDLGGIAKGMYADVLAELLAHWPGGVISAGGDMRIWGTSPDPRGWLVSVEDPGQPDRDVATIQMRRNGAVATSGTNRRSWQRGSRRFHHLIDPFTGLPAESGIRSVTATARTATEAEIATTAIFVGGDSAITSSWIWNLISSAIIIKESGEVIELRPT